MRSIFLTAAIAAAVFCLPAFAQREALLVSKIQVQQQEIRAGVQAGTGRYKDMPANTRSALIQKQDQLLSLLEGKRTTDELNDQQQIFAFNTLEWIEAAINDAEDDRLICERRAVIGSNRKERVCKTAAQLNREREEARQLMSRGSRCADAGCIGQ